MGCRCHHTKQSAHGSAKRGGANIIRCASVVSLLAPPWSGGERPCRGVGRGWLLSGERAGSEVAGLVVVRTNVTCWVPAYDRLRRSKKNVLTLARDIADQGLEFPGQRWPIPQPDAAHVDQLVELGRRLNAVVRAAHHGSENVEISELVALLEAIGEQSRLCAESFTAPDRKYRGVCVGPLSAKLNIHAPPDVMDAYKAAAAANGMRFSVWLRDGIAAYFREVSPRRSAESTQQVIAALWRIGGLFTQIGYLFDDGEALLAPVEDALGHLDGRLVMCGRRGGRGL